MLLASLLPPLPDDPMARSAWWSFAFELGGRWQAEATGCAALIGALAALLALRPELYDPSSDWWSIAPLLAISALAATLNWQTLRRGYLYAACILLNLAVSIWWIVYLQNQFPNFATFLEVNIIAICLSSILWLWLELRARRISGEVPGQNTSFLVHNLAALGSLIILIGIVLTGFGLESYHLSYLLDPPTVAWLALVSLGALMFACIWDQQARYPVAGLYLLGLVTGAMGLQTVGLVSARQWWAGMIFLAAYALGTSLIWRMRTKLIPLTQKLAMPQRLDPSATQLEWFGIFNILTVVVVVFIAYWIDLRFLDFNLRVTASLAVAAQAITFGLLAEGTFRHRWQRGAIGVFIIGAIFFGWSWLVPGSTGTWLNRSVVAMVETFAFTALYGLGLEKARKLAPAWADVTRACLPWILATGAVALFFSLGTEIFYQISFGAVRIRPLSLVAIGLTLAVSIAICLLFALSKKHDPLSLSERGRMRYVYVAELMLALLFLHIRLTMPWLFTGFFERYWPLAVMGLAYLGVVASEALRRRKLLVLAQPIERTGVFLPLLPVLGFWLAQSKVDYSVLLFVVGGLYGLLSILRRSFAFGVMAAIAGNGGLWYLLHQSADYQFLQHPQLWLIPVALSVLLAVYLNEDDFTEDQMAGIRYLSLVTIYASSTADIFINGVANSPWLPLLLGGFSLTGVFAGIIFRIRGLLLLGSVFLLLAIITMIWYASANLGWTWLWYVAGIVTGATIIFMFAVFEKKRGEVLRVVEGLKDWDR